MSVAIFSVMRMDNQSRGCLAFLFGFGGHTSTQGNRSSSTELRAGEEGNYHSGPSGYEDGVYVGGYAADFRAEQAIFDQSDDYEAEDH